jgi:hypothetical protein
MANTYLAYSTEDPEHVGLQCSHSPCCDVNFWFEVPEVFLPTVSPPHDQINSILF